MKAPWPTGNPPKGVTLTGKLIPWADDGSPVLLEMPGSEHQYLPVFSEAHALRAVMKHAGVGFASIKQIDDGRDFLDSVPLEIVVIVDPRFLPNGRIRFHQVQRSEHEA